MAEIHNYQNEANIFGDDDFYDIDFYNGTGYETKKIKGSTIKAGIIASVPAPSVKTIYSENDDVASDRTIKGVAGQFFFKMVDFSTFEFTAQNVESECFKINVPTGDSFTSFVIANSANNNPMFSIENGYVKINDKYRLPLADGQTGQILSTDGAGLAQWIDAPQTGVTSVESITGAVDVQGEGIIVSTNGQSLVLTSEELVEGRLFAPTTNVRFFSDNDIALYYNPKKGFWQLETKLFRIGLKGFFVYVTKDCETVYPQPYVETFCNIDNTVYDICPFSIAKQTESYRISVTVRPQYDELVETPLAPIYEWSGYVTTNEQGPQMVSTVTRTVNNMKQI